MYFISSQAGLFFISFTVGFPPCCGWKRSTWTQVQIFTFVQVALVLLLYSVTMRKKTPKKTLFEGNVIH